MKISLCMIVKDEEKNIINCLDRALKIVDEAIIVDTGSQDGTKKLIRESYGDDSRIKLIEHSWENDFSKARNQSIKYATGDWILVLDADERIFGKRKKLEEYIDKNSNKAYIIPIYNIMSKDDITITSSMIRFYKNENPRYEGAIHEQILVNGQKTLGEVVDGNICRIYHYGYTQSFFEEKDKENRNMDIIMEQIEREPNDPFHWYNKGVMEMAKGNNEGAIDDFIKSHHLTNKTRTSYHNDLVFRIIQCMLILKKYKEAIEFIKTVYKDPLIGAIPDLYYYWGIAYANAKKYSLAIKNFKKAIGIGEYEQGISKFGSGSFLPKIEWAKVLLLEKNTDLSIEKFKDAVLDPHNIRYQGLNELKHLLQRENRVEELENFEKTITEKENKNNSTAYAELEEYKLEVKKNIEECIEKGMIQEGKELIKAYEQIVKDDVETYSIKGVIAMIEGNLEHAERLLIKGLSIDDSNFDLLYNIAYLYQVSSRDKLATKYYKKALKNTKDQNDVDNIYELLEKLVVDENKEETSKEIVVKNSKEKIKVVFFPYKISMWDSLETVYRAFAKDENCIVDVVPIPYYELSKEKATPKYEGDRFPQDIPITHYSQYNIEKEKPDVVFVHNIYDQYNTITRVYDEYFTYNLKKHTSMLVYVPYHISSFFPPYGKQATYALPSIENVDKVIMVGDYVKRVAIKDGIPEWKVLSLGSPKLDSMVNNINKGRSYPKEWERKLKNKTVYVLDTGCLYFVDDPFRKIEEITNILNITNMDENTALIWRPHPLTRISIMKYLPELLKYYDKLTQHHIKVEKGIYNNVILDETDDYLHALNAADVLITGNGSLLGTYLLTEKKIIFLDNKMPNGSLLPQDVFYYFYDEKEPWYKLIQKINKGYDPLAIKRKGLASKIYKNTDGTCGEKVYQTTMDMITKNNLF